MCWHFPLPFQCFNIFHQWEWENHDEISTEMETVGGKRVLCWRAGTKAQWQKSQKHLQLLAKQGPPVCAFGCNSFMPCFPWLPLHCLGQHCTWSQTWGWVGICSTVRAGRSSHLLWFSEDLKVQEFINDQGLQKENSSFIIILLPSIWWLANSVLVSVCFYFCMYVYVHFYWRTLAIKVAAHHVQIALWTKRKMEDSFPQWDSSSVPTLIGEWL